MLLAPLTYTLAAEEAERIGVDHVARVSSGEGALNSLGEFSVKQGSFLVFVSTAQTMEIILYRAPIEHLMVSIDAQTSSLNDHNITLARTLWA